MVTFEKGPGILSGIRDFGKYLNANTIGTAIIATIFGCSVVFLPLEAARNGGLSLEASTSWIFSIYVFGGLLGVILSLWYKKPICGAWSIPGALLIGSIMQNFNFNEVVGSFFIAGVIVFIIGLTGYIRKIMLWLPQPIVMGMIAGAMFRFGTGMVSSIGNDPFMVILTIVVWVIFTKIMPKVPGVLWALIIGTTVALFTGNASISGLEFSISKPQIFIPAFNISAIFSIGIPLAIMVIAAENTQAMGSLMAENYDPPINTMTILSGLGGICTSFFGGANANIAGPMTAITSGPEGGPREGRYVGAVLNGILFAVFGLFAGPAAAFISMVPSTLLNTIVGLSMLGVLTSAFSTAFSGKCKIGAFFALCVAASGITLFKIGAPFWALIIGTIISVVLERKDIGLQKDNESNLEKTLQPQNA